VIYGLPEQSPRHDPELTPTILFLEKLLLFYVGGYHTVRLPARCPIPARGPAILISNHISSLDPVMIQSGCRRLIHWMMAREYYTIRSLRWFLGLIGAIPVDRARHDLGSIRKAIRALAAGQVVGMFPEGRIGLKEVGDFEVGAALLALRSGAPVYPVWVEGSTRGSEMVDAFLYPQKVTVVFGNAIALDRSDISRQSLERTAVMMRQAVLALQSRCDNPPPPQLLKNKNSLHFS